MIMVGRGWCSTVQPSSLMSQPVILSAASAPLTAVTRLTASKRCSHDTSLMQSKLPFLLLLLVVPTRGESQQPSDRPPVRQGGAWVLTTSRAEMPDQPSVTLELDAL